MDRRKFTVADLALAAAPAEAASMGVFGPILSYTAPGCLTCAVLRDVVRSVFVAGSMIFLMPLLFALGVVLEWTAILLAVSLQTSSLTPPVGWSSFSRGWHMAFASDREVKHAAFRTWL